MIHDAPYILPCGDRVNPTKPEGQYIDGSETFYCVLVANEPGEEPSRPRAIRSYGTVGKTWEIGTRHDMRHDQTGSRLGLATVVGIRYNGGRKVGQVFDRNVPHYCFK